MKNYKYVFALTVLLVSAFFIYKFMPSGNEVTKSSPRISGDSLINPNTEYLKEVRFSHDGSMAFEVPISEIMGREQKYGPLKSLRIPKKGEEREGPDRTNLKQNPDAPLTSQYPPSDSKVNNNGNPSDAPQTAGIKFNGSSGTSAGGPFPPDVMGEVGPTQYIVHVNGQLISYNKTTGIADGVLNTTPDNFFASVMSSNSGTYTSDPRIKYDRLSKKWYFLIIDVPAGTGAIANRVLVGVSPDSVITGSTIMKFFFYQHTTTFWDYPTLGVDANALYIGGNLFTLAGGSYSNTTAIVIRKSSIQASGPMVTTSMGNFLATSTSSGIYTPQGVDNPDPAATEGYLVGVDNAVFSRIVIKRISTPGGTPTISGDLNVTVSTTTSPVLVNHLGNSGGTNGRLDVLDDRLYMAQMRNGTLWTAHNVGVNNTGVSSSATRTGTRWYQFSNLTTTPILTQSGTVFDATANVDNYWIPTIATSGQNHTAISYSFAGANSRINTGTVGRLSSDALGTMQTPLALSNNSTFAYNPTGDPGGPSRRWGDYSSIRVDPNDDMTFWAINEYCSANNVYGCYVAQLKAPPPATPSSISPSSVPIGSNISVTLTGTSVSGSGFFDPGSGFANHLSVAIDGGVVVNSATYVNATTINLNVTTTGATQNTTRLVTVTNPDGQTSSATIFAVLPVELASFTSAVNKNDVRLNWSTVSEENNSGFDIERKLTAGNDWKKISFVQGSGNSNTTKNYEFVDRKIESGKYNYRLKQIDYNGNYKYYDLGTEVQVGVPSKFALYQNYPNPFNPSTKIDFDMPENGNVTLKIYDLTGKEVKTLLNGNKTAGYYSHSFNASALSSGIYFYSIVITGESGSRYSSVKKMMLVK
ncbi:MAG: T9SS type A sorting domain-containing protein [Bacteroidetes bacterium]|nr:T9SS type A sorting domain-containing protein [Bacteroidota bacterium]